MKAPRSSAVVVAVLGALALAGCTRGHPEQPPPAPDMADYVALGDSYTAVAGAGPFTDAACLRSDLDYPALVAKELAITKFTNASCAGASSSDLTTTQVTANKAGSNQPQLNSLRRDTKLVTIGLGLNDNGFSYYLTYVCLPVDGAVPIACKAYLKQPESGMPKVVKLLGDGIVADLEAVRERAPKARIVLVGYPRLLPESGSCNDQLPLPTVALERARSASKLVNDVMIAAARKTKSDFIDMYAASKGHDVCSSDPWVNGHKAIPGKALALHPYPAYHRAVADRIVKLLDEK